MTAIENAKKILAQKKKNNPKKYAEIGKKPPKPCVTPKSKGG